VTNLFIEEWHWPKLHTHTHTRSSFLKQNRVRVSLKDRPLNAVREIIGVYRETLNNATNV